jgi:hypothetical protein
LGPVVERIDLPLAKALRTYVFGKGLDIIIDMEVRGGGCLCLGGVDFISPSLVPTVWVLTGLIFLCPSCPLCRVVQWKYHVFIDVPRADEPGPVVVRGDDYLVRRAALRLRTLINSAEEQVGWVLHTLVARVWYYSMTWCCIH